LRIAQSSGHLNYGVMKTTSVLIASDEVNAIYASVHDVPEPLRRQLQASTTGRNSGTIVIADRRGKEEIEKAARFQQIAANNSLASRRVRWNRIWPALVALVIGAAGAWLAFVVRW
jgi:hypothetical protein